MFQVIYARGQLSTGLYFLVTGFVSLHWVDQNPPTIGALGQILAAHAGSQDRGINWRDRGPGGIFGELALFPDLSGRFRPESAVARSAGLAHMLPVSASPPFLVSYSDV